MDRPQTNGSAGLIVIALGLSLVLVASLATVQVRARQDAADSRRDRNAMAEILEECPNVVHSTKRCSCGEKCSCCPCEVIE